MLEKSQNTLLDDWNEVKGKLAHIKDEVKGKLARARDLIAELETKDKSLWSEEEQTNWLKSKASEDRLERWGLETSIMIEVANHRPFDLYQDDQGDLVLVKPLETTDRVIKKAVELGARITKIVELRKHE